MTRLWDEFELPFKLGEGVRLRAPREGTFWQLKDGPIIRVAAEEPVQDAEAHDKRTAQIPSLRTGPSRPWHRHGLIGVD